MCRAPASTILLHTLGEVLTTTWPVWGFRALRLYFIDTLSSPSSRPRKISLFWFFSAFMMSWSPFTSRTSLRMTSGSLFWIFSTISCFPFSDVTGIDCISNRLTAIKVQIIDRSFLLFSVYMPTDDISSLESLSEFLECLGEIRAIVEDNGVDSVFILGDFNANTQKRFGKELQNFCAEHQFVCLDWELFGIDSDTYTFLSDIDGTRSWLDHYLVSDAARNSVLNSSVNYEVSCSDHYPLKLSCNLNVLRRKNSVTSSQKSKIIWGERDLYHTELYTDYCFKYLRGINFPSEFNVCSDKLCDNVEHKIILDNMYRSLVDSLMKAAMYSNSDKTMYTHRKKSHVIGWNKHVSAHHKEARLRFWTGLTVVSLKVVPVTI